MESRMRKSAVLVMLLAITQSGCIAVGGYNSRGGWFFWLVREEIWRDLLAFVTKLDPFSTIGIAPNHAERFGYFMVSENPDVARIADFIERCANPNRS